MSEPGHLITGHRNPVTAAKFALLSWKVTIDEHSFDQVAELRGDSTPEQLADGFIVRGHDELQRLCELGDFCIADVGGVIKALLPHEMQELMR